VQLCWCLSSYCIFCGVVQGLANTALTACFAAPLFNILLANAVGYMGYFAANKVTFVHVHATPEVILGCVMLAIYNVAIVAIGALNKFQLPENFYLFARSWYALYLVLACLFGLLQGLGIMKS
jgi:dolichyl-phosphate-mannose--protein O-mannosyl transferase